MTREDGLFEVGYFFYPPKTLYLHIGQIDYFISDFSKNFRNYVLIHKSGIHFVEFFGIMSKHIIAERIIIDFSGIMS